MLAGEIVLPNDHLIRVYDWILVDGRPYRSQFYGNVKTVKKDISKKYNRNVRELRWCNKSYRKIRG